MSDERELPERVWIADLSGEGDFVWSADPVERDGVDWVPYLRADKPHYYVIRDRTGVVVSDDYESRTGALIAAFPDRGDTVHPVYVGPAIEPEEESDELE